MSETQKVIKYLAIAFGVVLIVGIFSGIYHLCMALTGSMIVSNDTKGLDLADYSSADKVLSVSVAAAKLEIKEGTELKVDTNNDYIVVEKEDNKLAVTEKKHKNIKKDKATVTVYIPKNMEFDVAYVSAGAGEMTIDNIISKDLKMDFGAGKVTINNIKTIEKTKIDGGVGKVVIKQAALSNAQIDLGVGEFELTSSFDGKNSIEAGVGALKLNLLGSKDDYKISAESGIGNLSVDGVRVKKESTIGDGNTTLKISGGIGDVNVKFK